MELYAYVLFLTVASYLVISIFYQKLVIGYILFSKNFTLRGREMFFVFSAYIFVMILAVPTALSSANLAFNYNFLLLSLIIGIPIGWLGVKISHTKPEYGFSIFILLLVVVSLIFKLLIFTSVI
jgi:hypothetical protein